MSRKILILSALVMSAMASYSCEEIDGGKTPAEPYYLEFVHEADASLVFNADYQGKYKISLNTNVPKKHLKVTPLDDQVWCSADIKDGGAILLTLGTGEDVSEDLSASFIIEVTKEDEEVEPLTFEVKRLYEAIEPSITVNYDGAQLEGTIPEITVPGSAKTISFIVETTAPLWKLEYDSYSDQEWVSVDKLSGASGETVTVTLSKNESGDIRNLNFTFSPVIAGTDVAVTVVLLQRAVSSIESVVVREYNNGQVGEIIQDKKMFHIGNAPTASTPFCFVVEVVGEGRVSIRFAEHGKNELYGYSDDIWMFGGSKDRDDENPDLGVYYRITAMGNTGEPRMMDAVLTDANDVELFRFCFTQEGGWVPPPPVIPAQ